MPGKVFRTPDKINPFPQPISNMLVEDANSDLSMSMIIFLRTTNQK